MQSAMAAPAPDLISRQTHYVASGGSTRSSHGTGSLFTPTMPIHGSGKPCRIGGARAWQLWTLSLHRMGFGCQPARVSKAAGCRNLQAQRG